MNTERRRSHNDLDPWRRRSNRPLRISLREVARGLDAVTAIDTEASERPNLVNDAFADLLMSVRTNDVLLEERAYRTLRKTAAKIAQGYPAVLRNEEWQSVADETIAKKIQRYKGQTLAEIQTLWEQKKFAYLYIAIERDFRDDIRKRGRQWYAMSFGRDDSSTPHTAEDGGSEGTAIDRLSDQHTYELWRDSIPEPDSQELAQSLEQASRPLKPGPKRVTGVLAEPARVNEFETSVHGI